MMYFFISKDFILFFGYTGAGTASHENTIERKEDNDICKTL